MKNLRKIISTGLKVYGEGEWKVRQHDYSKRRTWRKPHLAIYPDSNEILFVKLTDQGQQSEAPVKAKALNIMTSLGMPQSIRKVA